MRWKHVIGLAVLSAFLMGLWGCARRVTRRSLPQDMVVIAQEGVFLVIPGEGGFRLRPVAEGISGIMGGCWLSDGRLLLIRGEKVEYEGEIILRLEGLHLVDPREGQAVSTLAFSHIYARPEDVWSLNFTGDSPKIYLPVCRDPEGRKSLFPSSPPPKGEAKLLDLPSGEEIPVLVEGEPLSLTIFDFCWSQFLRDGEEKIFYHQGSSIYWGKVEKGVLRLAKFYETPGRIERMGYNPVANRLVLYGFDGSSPVILSLDLQGRAEEILKGESTSPRGMIWPPGPIFSMGRTPWVSCYMEVPAKGQPRAYG